MLFILLCALLLTAPTNQACAVGCLKCNSSDECLFSDLSNFYRINGISPEKVNITNCTSISIEGICLSCNSKYYLDTVTNKCVAIEESSLISNCMLYSSNSSCFTCNPKFYLSSNTCIAVEDTIPNCEIYSNETTCMRCKSGYLLFIDKQVCVPGPSLKNCAQFSFIKCNSCASGYFLNVNAYFAELFKFSSAPEKNYLGDFLKSAIRGTSLAPQISCEVQSTDNCSKFDDNNVCVTCASGYYKTKDSLCVKYPDQPIENCLNYTTGKICTECIPGYYFRSGGCTPIPLTQFIANCEIHDGTASMIKCSKCSSNYYLDGTGCTIRIKSTIENIAGCLTRSATQDICVACSDGFVISNDGLKCFPIISNCKIYEATTVNDKLKCLQCKDEYYLRSSKYFIDGKDEILIECLQGDVDNCAQYKTTDSKVCDYCMDSFVLSGNQCVKGVEIPDCIDYSPAIFNTCLKCKVEETFNFKIVSKCEKIINNIENCANYISGTITEPTCSECDPGYYLANNICSKIDSDNCLRLDNDNKCILCGKGYALSTYSNKCVPAFEYITNNCQLASTDDATNDEMSINVTCKVCQEKTLPFNYLNHYTCVSNSEIKEFGSSKTIVDGCLKYNQNLECVQCDAQGSKPYLKTSDSPPSCNSQCNGSNAGPFDKVLLEIASSSGITGQINQFNVCRSSAVSENCLIHGPDVSTDGNQICIGCDSSSIAYIYLTETKYSSVNPSASGQDSYIPSPFSIFPKLYCAKTSGITNINGTGTASLPALCQYYVSTDVSAGVFGCIKCNHRHSSRPNLSGYLINCDLDDSMSTDIYYNLDMLWVYTVSGHACSADNLIPFIGYSGVSLSDPSFTGFHTWNSKIGVSATFSSNTGTEKSITCAENVGLSFGVPNANFGVVAKCGLGAIQVNTNGMGNNSTNLGSYCAACKPGYLSKNHSSYPFVKTSCTAIANCAANSTMFNACSNCKEGFLLKYDTSINYTVCLAVTTDSAAILGNCMAATPSSSNILQAAACKVCKKGYSLNADGYCEKLSPIYCGTGQFLTSTLRNFAEWNWSLWLASNGVGCNRCNDLYSGIKIDSDKAVCLKSTWASNYINTLTKDKTSYIPHCNLYVASATATLCEMCDEGYVMNGTSSEVLQRTECYAGTNLPFCKVANSSSKCLACKSTEYALIGNKCVLGTLENCSEYFYNENNSTLKCSKCASGFYLDTSRYTCFAAEIYNCEQSENDQPTQCKVCKSGFTKLLINKNIIYCYPNEPSLGCDNFDISSGELGGVVGCKTCANPNKMLQVTVDPSANQTICMNFNTVLNCKKYDLGSSLSSSTFFCVECDQAFYLKKNVCVERVNATDKCKTYFLDDDKCKECTSNSYVSSDFKGCVDYPKGIIGCRTYSDAEKCMSCKEERYLWNNSCIRVTTSIDDCKNYSSDSVCGECYDNFILSNNACVKAAAVSCLKYSTAKACATCNVGFGLETINEITNCVSKVKTGCLDIDINPPYNCIKCEGQYYIESGECRTPTIIQNCIVYASKTTCSACKATYALSLDKATCVKSDIVTTYIGKNCEDSTILSTPICTRCAAGYYLVDQECTGSCNLNKRGCFSCNPRNPSTCYMCSPNYYQGKDGNCVYYGPVIDDSQSFFGIIKVLIVYILSSYIYY